MTCGEIALLLNNIMESLEMMPDYICNTETMRREKKKKTVVINGATVYGVEYILKKKAIEKLMELEVNEDAQKDR